MSYRSILALVKPGSFSKEEESAYHQLPLHDLQLESSEEGVHNETKESQLRPRWLRDSLRPNWLWRIAPWFLAAPLGKTQRRLPHKSSTSYLNGVRGIACIIVYNIHINDHYYHNFHNPYGAEPAAENHGISQLPIVRIMYAGKGMVCVFFVLSGFVLTYSPLRKIVNPSPSSASDLVTGLCSSLLRRGIRLYAPMMVLVFLTCLATWNYPSFHPGHWRDANPTFLQHAWRYVLIALPLFNPFAWEPYLPESFNQCWTLAAEYRGSMVVLLMCMATSRLNTRARKLVIASSAAWAMFWLRGDMYCFLSGMLLAELRYSPLSKDLPFLKGYVMPRAVSYTLATCLLLLSMLIIGWPENGDGGVQPFKTLAPLTPNAWRLSGGSIAFFWGSIGAPALLLAIENLPPAQWLLSSTPIMYLGEISFSFYLLHWMAYMWPGVEMMICFTQRFGWSGGVSFYIMAILTFGLLIVASDYYWRVVDESCVRLGKVVVNWLGVHSSSHVVAVDTPEEEPELSKDDGEEHLPK